ncbi:MAG: metallophosphoesterase family protein [Acidimicrobiales bacterium]
MVRFLHTADWQLGMTRHFLDADAQPRFSAARIEAVAAIGALAVAERCSFVVVSGDVFETNHVERQVVCRALDAMAATPSVTFYLLPGNHDPLDASSVFRSPTFTAHQPPNVVVLASSEPVAVAPGVEVVGAPWATKRPLTDLLARATEPLTADGTVRIAVGHGAVDQLMANRTDPAAISVAALEAALDDGRVAYVALGDRHSTTSVGTTDRIWYAGAPEATDFRETDPGNVLVVELDGSSVWVEARRIGTWSFVLQRAALASAADVESLHASLEATPDKGRAIVKVALVGQLTLTAKARLDEVLAHHALMLASLDTWDLHTELVVVPDDDDFGDLDLSGFARDALEDLRSHAIAGPDGDGAARDALALLVRLVGGAA